MEYRNYYIKIIDSLFLQLYVILFNLSNVYCNVTFKSYWLFSQSPFACPHLLIHILFLITFHTYWKFWVKISICEVLCGINLLFCCFFRLTLMITFFLLWSQLWIWLHIFSFPLLHLILSLSLLPSSHSTFIPQLPVPHQLWGTVLGMSPGSSFSKVVGSPLAPSLRHHGGPSCSTVAGLGKVPSTLSWQFPVGLTHFSENIYCVFGCSLFSGLSAFSLLSHFSLGTLILGMFSTVCLSQSTCILNFIPFCYKYYPWVLLSV